MHEEVEAENVEQEDAHEDAVEVQEAAVHHAYAAGQIEPRFD